MDGLTLAVILLALAVAGAVVWILHHGRGLNAIENKLAAMSARPACTSPRVCPRIPDAVRDEMRGTIARTQSRERCFHCHGDRWLWANHFLAMPLVAGDDTRIPSADAPCSVYARFCRNCGAVQMFNTGVLHASAYGHKHGVDVVWPEDRAEVAGTIGTETRS